MGNMKLEAIAVRATPRKKMTELSKACVTNERGVDGDSRGNAGPRQVTVLSSEAWHAACRDVGTDLPWTLRRANLLIRGIKLADTTGATLRIGKVLLEITGETLPCSRMDEQHPGLTQSLEPDWRGGVCCLVRVAGVVRVGDDVEINQGTR